MAMQAGRAVVITFDGTDLATSLRQRGRGVQYSGAPIDVSGATDSEWAEYMSDFDLRGASISLDGVEIDQEIHKAFLAGTQAPVVVTYDTETLSGTGMFSAYTQSFNYNESRNFTATLTFVGAPTLAVIP